MMKKIKIFLDPMSNLEKWLNVVAKRGYRLKAIYNFLYVFEETDKEYAYSTQFLGANSPKENDKYIQMLRESDMRLFRAPLNQGNIVFGKFRFRAYAKGSGKFVTSFNGYNKEILVVETLGREPEKLLSKNMDLAEEYRNIRNAYLQGVIAMYGLLAYGIYFIYITDFSALKFILISLLGVFTIIYSIIAFKMHKNYQSYKKEASLAN